MNRPIRRDLYRYPGNSIQGREAVGGIGGKREGPSGPVCWLRRCCRLFRVKNLTLAAFGNAPLLLLTWRLRCPARRPSSSLAHQANQTRARSVWHTAEIPAVLVHNRHGGQLTSGLAWDGLVDGALLPGSLSRDNPCEGSIPESGDETRSVLNHGNTRQPTR